MASDLESHSGSSAHLEKAAASDKPAWKSAPFFVKPGKGYWRRSGQSFKRWWWLDAIILIVVTLVVVLPIIYVGYPKIAQSQINDAQLHIQSLALSQPQPDSFHLAINSTIDTSASQDPVFDPFDAVFYLTDVPGHPPFLNLRFPEVHSSHSTPVNVSENIQITNATRDAFIQYNQWVLHNETYNVTVSGETDIHYLAFPTEKINFTHTVEQKGLNGFKGLYTDNLNVSLGFDDRNNNFGADVHIYNPSTLTLNLGNATFDNYFNGSIFGYSYIDNFTLRPGNNTVFLRATNNQSPILKAVSSHPYCETGRLPVEIRPRHVYSGNQEIDYFQEAMRTLVLRQDLDIAGAIAKLSGQRPACPNSTTS